MPQFRPLLIAACLLLLVACGSSHAAPPASITLPCTIVRAIDGDTVDVDVTVRVRVRLKDCWAPEKNTPQGKRAADSLNLATAGLGGDVLTGTVQIPIPSMDMQDWFSFGRPVGYITIDGHKKSLGEQMIEKGLASSKKGGKLGE